MISVMKTIMGCKNSVKVCLGGRVWVGVASALMMAGMLVSCDFFHFSFLVDPVVPEEEEYTYSGVRVDFMVDGLFGGSTTSTISSPSTPSTKAVRSDWSTGDVLNIWFDDCTTPCNGPQLTLTYKGGKWLPAWNAGFESWMLKRDSTGIIKVLYEGANDISRFSKDSLMLYGTPVNGYPVYATGFMAVAGTDGNSVSYSYGNDSVFAHIGGWVMATPKQIVVSEIPYEDADKYALKCDQLTVSCAEIGTGCASYTDYSADRFVKGFPNPDGVAFYFGIPLTGSTVDYTFTLYEYSTGKTKSYTASSKSLSLDRSQIQGIKLKYSHFAE